MPGALWTWQARRRGVVSSDGWVDAVIVEVNGRWFLTDTFVDNPGEELDRGADAATIGRAVRRWLRDRPRRPGPADPRPDPDAWADFCADVMEVDAGDHHRDRSLVVAVRGGMFRCWDALAGDAVEHEVAAHDDAVVGAAVLDQLGRLPLRSRLVARAGVALVDGVWQAMATPDQRWSSHVFAAEPGGLVDAVVAALDKAAALTEFGPADRFEDRSLRAVTWVPVARRADGGLVVLDGDGTVDVDAADLEAAVRDRLAAAPTEPVEDGGATATWLVVPSANAQLVVDALGLVDALRIGPADGIVWAMDEGVVVLPAIDGWTFAVGHDLALHLVDIGPAVRSFVTHRVDDLREWSWAEVDRAPAGRWPIDPTRLATLQDADAIWGRLP